MPLITIPIDRLCATDEDVVHRNVNNLHDVSDESHNQETGTDGLADLNEFTLVGLLASVDELHAIFQKLPRHIEQFLHLV